MSVSFLEKHGYAVVKPESPSSRAKVLVLTAKGGQAQDAYHELVWAIEERWQASFGMETVRALRRRHVSAWSASSLPGYNLCFAGQSPILMGG